MEPLEIDREEQDAIQHSRPVRLDPKDFAAGTLAGMVIVLVGHPLDTLKVRLQTQDVQPPSTVSGNSAPSDLRSSVSTSTLKSVTTPIETSASSSRVSAVSSSPKLFSSPFSLLRHTLKYEGFAGLYKGMSSPMVTVPIINAIVFASYEQGKRFLAPSPSSKPVSSSSALPLPLLTISVAGGWAGFVNCLVVSPVELVKSRLQVQYESSSSSSSYSGASDVIRKIVRERGVFGLGRGMVATIAREVPAYSAQFGMYELCKRSLAQRYEVPSSNSSSSTLPTWCLLVSGGVAGIGCWVFSYPQDVIKSRLQIQPDSIPPNYPPRFFDGGFTRCLQETVKNEGVTALWKGFSPCLARAFLANGVGFVAYEASLEWINRTWPSNEEAAGNSINSQ